MPFRANFDDKMRRAVSNSMYTEHQGQYCMSRDPAMYSFKSLKRKQALSETRA